MAHAMNIFRKRKKTMLAILGVLCMFIFVVGGTQNFYPGSGGDVRDPVVATTVYGEIHAGELQQTRFIRSQVMDFLNNLVNTARQKAFETQQFGWQARAELSPIGGENEESAVMVGLVARKAADLGIVVNDDAVNQYLRDLTGDMVGREAMRDLIQNFTSREISNKQLYDGLRREVQAVRLRQLFLMGQGPGAMPPAQRWEYYQRIKQRAKVELLAIPASELLGEAPEPTDAQVLEYFEKHKDRLPNPYSAEPGFRVPRMVGLEYLRADFEKFKKAVEPEVTDKEIEDHYEANKESLYKKAKGFDDPLKKDDDKETDKDPQDDDAKPAGDKPAEDGATDEAKPDAGDKPADDKPTDDKPDGDKPAGDAPPAKPDADKPDADKPAAEKPSDKPKQSSAGRSLQPSTDGRTESRAARLVGFDKLSGAAFQLAQAEKTTPADNAKSAEGAKPVAGAKPAADNPPAAQEGEEPAAEKPADPAADPPASDAAEGEAPAGDKPDPAKEGTQDDPANTASTEADFKPLDEVKEQIRTQLAGNKARDKIKKLFDGLKAKMEGFRFDQLAAGDDGAAVKPPDLEALAAEYGLDHRVIPPATFDDLDTDALFGQSFSFVQFRTVRSVVLLFTRLQLFQPETAQELSGDQFLFWKTADEKEHSAALDDAGIRDQVIKAWKVEQAREPALKKAQALADQAKGKPESLREALAGQTDLGVIETEFFSWMLSGSFTAEGQRQPPRISDVVGVDKPGNDFMKAVFGLQPGELTVEMNEPKSIAYVIRLVDYEKLLPVLQREFMADSLNLYGELASDDFRQVADQWLTQIGEEAGVDWKRPPDRLASNE